MLCFTDDGDLRSDTTAGAIAVMIMAATLFPRVTKRAQDQIDKVVGSDKSPIFNDQADLPYITAFVKEVQRWRPISQGGFAHVATEDVHYKSFAIPKGTAILGNHWSISRDPNVFPNPEEFRPERWFVDEDVEKGELRKDINHVGYGFGRRICGE